MSSGSLKDLTRAVSTVTSNPALPLPDDLLEVLTAYLQKHAAYDDSESQKLQDELLTIYARDVAEKPSALAPFLAILRALKTGIRGSGRLLQWWDKLSNLVLTNLGQEKGLAVEAKNTLLGILVDESEEDSEELVKEARETSDRIAESLIETWLSKSVSAATNFDGEAQFVEGQVKLILLSFGRRKPKDLLTIIDNAFVKRESRILALSLLCEFIQQQPPHLHQLLQTPLFDNLLRCLLIDTSTRVISLAMTALIMFLPHIPSSLSKHLPALFNIYSRMLFWDRERRASDTSAIDEDSVEGEKLLPGLPEDNKPWAKVSMLLESEDETVPELLHYFTFLYGLYPINFMSYIRKPQKYLRHASFAGADDLDIQPTEVRERSEPFREVHLLHPNFFIMTIESELEDNNRWMRSEAADVVAECMALYAPGDEDRPHITRTLSTKKIEPNADVPEQPLAEQDVSTPDQSRHTSWRNTTSTAVASPDGGRAAGVHRKASQTSQSKPSIADSPSLHPANHLDDSPTLPPHSQIAPGSNALHEMLNSRSERLTRGSIQHSLAGGALTNDSVASLALSTQYNDTNTHVDTYLQSLSRESALPRSPSIRPTTGPDINMKIAYLHREIQLLRNDLNFERYLKQQHISHIGQLRRKQIREARVEAETQNLINSNRGLKSKLEESKRAITQMKKEHEKSKSHSRKWEADLSSKLRTLRDEQKKWNIERSDLQRNLETERRDKDSLRQLAISSESKELSAKQKVQSVEASLDELERLRAEVDKLIAQIRTHEAAESDAMAAREIAEAAEARVKMLEMQVGARDAEAAQSKKAFELELDAVRNSKQGVLDVGDGNKGKITQDMLDAALATSRTKIVEIRKAHAHLLKRYEKLQERYMELKQQADTDTRGEESLLGGQVSPSRSTRGNSRATSPTPVLATATSSARQVKPDATVKSGTSTPVETENQSPVQKKEKHGAGIFHPFRPREDIQDGESVASGDGSSKKKVAPPSDIRFYGRGGVQNIGKKDKDKKDKDKGKGAEGKKEEKKGASLRGIRAFV